MSSKTKKAPKAVRTIRFWIRALLLVVVVFVIAVVVAAAVIAQDPNNAANGVNGFFGALAAGTRAVLHAPIAFFGALLHFVDNLVH